MQANTSSNGATAITPLLQEETADAAGVTFHGEVTNSSLHGKDFLPNRSVSSSQT